MNKENFEKKHPGLKEEMMMEESIASADLAKQESIRIDIQDIKSVLSMLEGGTERKEIINFFKEYIYAEKPKRI